MGKTIQASKAPQSRVDAGDAVQNAARRAATGAVKQDLAEFAKVHAEYKAAEADVRKAEAAKRAQEVIVGDKDVVQDAGVDELARQLIADGLPKGNPFKALDSKDPFPAPSSLRGIGYADEAKLVRKLAAAVKKKKGLSKRTLDAAAAADKAALEVQAALAPMVKLAQAFTTAIQEREALAQSWETAFATLKAAVRYVDTKNKTRLFAALFQSGPAASAGKKAKAAQKAKGPAKGADKAAGSEPTGSAK